MLVRTYGARVARKHDKATAETTRGAVDMEGAWPHFQYGAWTFLWENRDRVLWQFKVWRLPLKTLRLEDLRSLFVLGFGECPFDWSRGPAPGIIL